MNSGVSEIFPFMTGLLRVVDINVGIDGWMEGGMKVCMDGCVYDCMYAARLQAGFVCTIYSLQISFRLALHIRSKVQIYFGFVLQIRSKLRMYFGFSPQIRSKVQMYLRFVLQIRSKVGTSRLLKPTRSCTAF